MEIIAASTFTTTIISQTILKGYALFTDILNYNLNEINSTIERIDIQNTLKIANSIIKDIENKNIQKDSALYTILSVIHEIIEKINTTMNELKNLIDDHCNKYFYTWRAVNYLEHISRLKDYNSRLNERIELLLCFDLTTIHSSSSDSYSI